jgi:hypothetical protein
MTGKIGGLSTPIIAMIAVLGIAGLLILTTVLAFLVDLPGRIRRNKAAKQDGRKSIMDEADVEKAEPVVTVTEMNSQSSYSSQDTCTVTSLPVRASSSSVTSVGHGTTTSIAHGG